MGLCYPPEEESNHEPSQEHGGSEAVDGSHGKNIPET